MFVISRSSLSLYHGQLDDIEDNQKNVIIANKIYPGWHKTIESRT